MNVLDHTLIWDWCREHRVALNGDAPGSEGPISLREDPTLSQRRRRVYAHGVRSGQESAFATAAVAALGAWEECLVWVTTWGVWESSEDWPRFYAWRAEYHERRSLEAAPGHLFRAEEAGSTTELLTQILENGWDATLLLAYGGSTVDRRVVTSHDEWIEVQSREPVAFAVALA